MKKTIVVLIKSDKKSLNIVFILAACLKNTIQAKNPKIPVEKAYVRLDKLNIINYSLIFSAAGLTHIEERLNEYPGFANFKIFKNIF